VRFLPHGTRGAFFIFVGFAKNHEKRLPGELLYFENFHIKFAPSYGHGRGVVFGRARHGPFARGTNSKRSSREKLVPDSSR